MMRHHVHIYAFGKLSDESIFSYSSDASAKYVLLLIRASSLYLSLTWLQPAQSPPFGHGWASFSVYGDKLWRRSLGHTFNACCSVWSKGLRSRFRRAQSLLSRRAFGGVNE